MFTEICVFKCDLIDLEIILNVSVLQRNISKKYYDFQLIRLAIFSNDQFHTGELKFHKLCFMRHDDNIIYWSQFVNHFPKDWWIIHNCYKENKTPCMEFMSCCKSIARLKHEILIIYLFNVNSLISKKIGILISHVHCVIPWS